jgi:hypothetical protein
MSNPFLFESLGKPTSHPVRLNPNPSLQITTLNGEFALSLGVVLGSGLVSFGAIPPACFFAATGGGLTHDNRQTLKLRVWPVLRDTVGGVREKHAK